MSHINASSRSRSHSSSRTGSSVSRTSSRKATPGTASLKYVAPGLEGSWFPSGFYGFERSKARQDIDFGRDVRQRAMPRPPERLESTFRVSVRKHPFSQHDNKHTYCNEGEYFGQGMGKRRVTGRSGKFKPEFLHWAVANEGGGDTPVHRRSVSSLGDYRTNNHYPGSPLYQTGRVMTLDDESCTSGHRRGFTAPSRLFNPPAERTENSLWCSNYQHSFGQDTRPSSQAAHSGLSSRPSGSHRSPALPSPDAVSMPRSAMISPDMTRPGSPTAGVRSPPASGVMSPADGLRPPSFGMTSPTGGIASPGSAPFREATPYAQLAQPAPVAVADA